MKRFFWLFVMLLAIVALARLASAAGEPVTLNDPLSGQTLQDVVDKVTTGLIQIATPIVGIMFVIGGFQIMVAGGNAEKVKQGRSTLLYAAIGFAVILVATSVHLVLVDVLKKP